MSLRPTDDYVLLEEIAHEDGGKIQLLARDPNEKKKARVIAVGPGSPNGRTVITNSNPHHPIGDTTLVFGRNPQPCEVGDVVLVHAGAGFRTKFDGKEYWFVNGSRGDIIAVVE